MTICSVLYAEAAPFFNDFISGIRQACECSGGSKSVDILFINDGVNNVEQLLKPLSDSIKVTTIDAPESLIPTDVRSLLLTAARDVGREGLVFADCDDILEAKALQLHSEVLSEFDFSYSDQILISNEGELLGKTLYGDWNVPICISEPDSLIDGNFTGFSGAAMNKRCLSDMVCAIPHDVIATDWWVFSQLLLEGNCGGKTAEAVVRYRQHVANFHGASPKLNHETVSRYCQIAKVHYQSFSDNADYQLRLKGINKLEKQLEKYSNEVVTMLEDERFKNNYWYADVTSLGMELAGFVRD